MKDLLILIGAVSYTSLFYMQDPGLNFPLFSLSAIAMLVMLKSDLIKRFQWWLIATATMFSAFWVGYYGSPLTVIANIISLVVLSGISFDPKSSLIVSSFHSLWSILLSLPFFMSRILNSFRKESRTHLHYAFAAVLMIVCFVFLLVYINSSPIFEKLVDNLLSEILDIDVFLFFFLGWVLMLGFLNHYVVEKLHIRDIHTNDELQLHQDRDQPITFLGFEMTTPDELKVGTLLFILLNILLGIVNVSDYYFVFIASSLPEGLTYSDYVHNGIYSLITSTILAVSIIVVVFRGRLNFLEDNKWLKAWCFAWISQNILLIGSTMYRNYAYIEQYQLTHKRIGVFIYLALCVIGLTITFFKVSKIKNNWFLFRKGYWSFYIVLLMACPVNWNSIIIQYNLKNSEDPDMDYIVSLGDSHIIPLKKFLDYETASTLPQYATLLYNLNQSMADFEAYHNDKDFRSWNYQDHKTLEFISESTSKNTDDENNRRNY